MTKKSIFAFVVLFCYSSIVMSQGAVELICRILDSQDRFPVSYATIQFEGESKGLIANAEGSFRLPGEFKQTNRQIIISSIGYETLILKVNTLNYKSINIINLKPKVEGLDAVFIKSQKSNQVNQESSSTIIRKAISKIPKNYPNQPHSYVSYYRDYQIVNGNYYNLNEGILEDFDAGFDTNKFRYKDNQAALYSYDLNKEFYQDTLLLNSIYGESKILDEHDGAKLGAKIRNELEILNIHNPIRNYNKSSFSFIYVLKDDFLSNHEFGTPKTISKGDMPLYEIEFYTPLNEQSKFRATGKIYISKSTYAIHKLYYHVFENVNYVGDRQNTNSLFGFNTQGSKNANTLFEINIEYKDVEGKMYLNYMTFNNRFIIKDPNPFKEETFEVDSETNSFYFTFNKAVDENSIKNKSRFKLYFRGKKLIINDVELLDEKTVKISVIDWAAGSKTNVSETKPEDFTYKLKRIKDISGLTIYKDSQLLGFQFREFFTQEIFENKLPTSDLFYLDKTLPLSSSKLNNNKLDINKYWINSPLKETSETER